MNTRMFTDAQAIMAHAEDLRQASLEADDESEADDLYQQHLDAFELGNAAILAAVQAEED